jgi:hypothetical protein
MWIGRRWRRVSLVGLVCLLGLLSLTGCRGQPTIMEVWATDDDLVIEVILDTCNADVSVDVVEYDDRVVVRATNHDAHLIDTGSDDCRDGVRVDLEKPLGDRRVTDSSGVEIVVTQPPWAVGSTESTEQGDLPDVEPPEMFDPPTDAELSDLQFIAERDGISLEEAVAAYGWRRGFSQLVQEIAVWHRKSYAGAAIEPDGSIWIAFKGDVPSDVVSLVRQFEREVLEPLGLSTRIELVPDRGFTERELNARVIAAYYAVYDRSPLVSDVSAAADPRTGEIQMVVRSVGADVARTEADVRARVSDDVKVRVTYFAFGEGDGLNGPVYAVVHEVRVVDELVLEVVLDTCTADVSVDVDEYDDRIMVEARYHDWYRFLTFHPACQDLVRVDIEQALGDRRVTSSSGEEIVVKRQIGHAAVIELRAVDNGLGLEVLLDTCNADVSVDVDEYDDRIVVHATNPDWHLFVAGDDCQDGVRVELDRPLGDRRVTDSSGGEIAVTQRP